MQSSGGAGVLVFTVAHRRDLTGAGGDCGVHESMNLCRASAACADYHALVRRGGVCAMPKRSGVERYGWRMAEIPWRFMCACRGGFETRPYGEQRV